MVKASLNPHGRGSYTLSLKNILYGIRKLLYFSKVYKGFFG